MTLGSVWLRGYDCEKLFFWALGYGLLSHGPEPDGRLQGIFKRNKFMIYILFIFFPFLKGS